MGPAGCTTSRTIVESNDGGGGLPCDERAPTDVLFYPPVGYCAIAAGVEYDWLHYQLGLAPPA